MSTLHASGLSKRYGGVDALADAHLDLRAGAVTALVGENGAGKSTLVKILAGAVRPDQGTVSVDGRTVAPGDVRAAQAAGISVIHQSGGLAGDLTIAQNVFLGAELRGGSWMPRALDRRAMFARTRELLARYAPELDPDQLVGGLTAQQRKVVSIVRALVHEARVVILDEPTAALPAADRGRLLETVAALRSHDVALMYVSHHLEEIEAVADDVVVLRDGRRVGYEQGPISAKRVAELMLGAELSEALFDVRPQTPAGTAATAIAVRPPSGGEEGSEVRDAVELRIAAGEIVLLTGLAGSGVGDVAEAAFGCRPKWRATLTRGDEKLEIATPTDAIGGGIGYLSDDRVGRAVLPGVSILRNVSATALPRFTGRCGRVDERREREQVDAVLRRLRVKLHSLDQDIMELSGGNQQKCVLARWLLAGSRLLILNEPTQGIDVGAKADVLRLLEQFVAEGASVLLVATDPVEFLPLANRTLVMRRGSIVAELDAAHATADRVATASLTAQATTELTGDPA